MKKSLTAMLKSISKFFTRSFYLDETKDEDVVNEIKKILETTSIALPKEHGEIGKAWRTKYTKRIDGNDIIIDSNYEILKITKWEIIYLRKHKTRADMYKHKIILDRFPLQFNKKKSFISPGFMKSFMQKYLRVLANNTIVSGMQ